MSKLVSEDQRRRFIYASHEPRVETIWVECIDCGKRDEIKRDLGIHEDGMTNLAAGKYFRNRGWTIRPTRCKRCNKKS